MGVHVDLAHFRVSAKGLCSPFVTLRGWCRGLGQLRALFGLRSKPALLDLSHCLWFSWTSLGERKELPSRGIKPALWVENCFVLGTKC